MDTPSSRRAQLLDKIVEVLLADGVGDLSLRPLAERVGTSARLLIYHFGSKDELVAAALAEVRRQIGAALAERAARVRPRSLRALMAMVWAFAAEPANQGYFRLLFEVDGLAMFERIRFSPQVHRANTDIWIALIERAAERLPEDGARLREHSTLIVCAFSGLLQEFLSTGERTRTSAALAALLDLISPGVDAPAQSQGTQR